MGLSFRGELGIRTAAIVGSGVGGMSTLDDNFRRLYAEGAKRFHPLTIPKMMISAAVSHITMEFGIRGPAFTVASACASANHAIGTAFQMIRSGAVKVAVTGGTESVFHSRHAQGLGSYADIGARHLQTVFPRPKGARSR